MHALGSVARILNGETLPACTLEQALAQTRVVNGAFLSSPIVTAPESACEEVAVGEHDRLRSISAMNAMLDAGLATGRLPSETGLAPWLKPGRRVDVRQLRAYP